MTDIPVDTILDNLLPCIAVPDLLHLACTNRFFATLLTDELFWERKFKDDFIVTSAVTDRRKTWKLLYRALWNSKVYVRGCQCVHLRIGIRFMNSPFEVMSYTVHCV
jgi:SCF-associated factor 1